MSYFVSRQAQYYSGSHIVEVADGLDSSGPDMLAESYKNLGEGRLFDDPREAANAAIVICQTWRRDCPEDKPKVSWQTRLWGEMGGESEPMTFKALRNAASQEYEKLPKCEYCGGLYEDGKYWTLPWIFSGEDERMCSENCADKRLEDILSADADLAAEYEEMIA